MVSADGVIFALDPDTLDVVKSKVIYVGVHEYGKWLPVHLRWGKDGLLYTTLASQVTVIDPETLDHERLAVSALMTLDDDGIGYYVQGVTLMKVEVTDPE